MKEKTYPITAPLQGTAEGAAMDAVEKGIVGSADEEGHY